MRILVAHLVGSARIGGMSRLMGRAHDELQRDGHEITYLSADDVGPAMRGKAGRLLFPWQVRREVVDAARRGCPYDIVNVHEPHGAPVTAVRRGQNGTAVVAMTHGVEQRGWELSLSTAQMRPSLKTRCIYPVSSLWQSRVALTRADHVICLNTQDREFLAERLSVDAGCVTCVTPGADAVYGEAAAGRTYRRARTLLFAGTWVARKGTHVLAAACEELWKEGLPLELLVLGAGVPTETIAAAFSTEHRGRVRSVTARSDAEAAAVMATADVFVLPSLFEGTPLTLIEAMWSGLPVITTATAGMKDVVRGGETGVLLPAGSVDALTAAIRELWINPDRCRQLGTAAHATAVREYTWRRTADAFGRAYESAKRRHG